MAQWSNSSGNKIRPYRSAYGPPSIRYFEESTAASSDVINVGDVVTSDTLVTTGGLRILHAPSSGGTGTNLMQVGAIKSLIGVALQKSTGDGSTTGITANGLGTDNNRKIAVCLAHPLQEFIGYTSTLNGGDGVASNLFVGLNRPIVFDRNLHTYFVASTNSTAALAAVTITEVPQSVYGDSGGFPVIFRFLSSLASPVVGGGGQ